MRPRLERGPAGCRRAARIHHHAVVGVLWPPNQPKNFCVPWSMKSDPIMTRGIKNARFGFAHHFLKRVSPRFARIRVRRVVRLSTFLFTRLCQIRISTIDQNRVRPALEIIEGILDKGFLMPSLFDGLFPTASHGHTVSESEDRQVVQLARPGRTPDSID